MSQARKIYEYLTRTDNRAADKALTLALRRAQSPYQIAIVETILDRSQAASTVALISGYHEFQPDWQDILLGRVDSLYSGLSRAGTAGPRQTRFNTLAIIKQTRYFRLADLVVTMLRDSDGAVARCAGDILISMARWLNGAEPTSHSEPANHTPAASDETDISSDQADLRERQMFVAALRRAVADYAIHQRAEAIIAAMCLVPPDAESFWPQQLAPYDIVGKTVRHLLLNYDRPEVAAFCLAALKHPTLRPTAARAIASHCRRDYLTAIIRHFRACCDDEAIFHGLKLVRNPRWLDPAVLPPTSMSNHDQHTLVEFVSALPSACAGVGQYLTALARNGAERAALLAVERIAQMPTEDAHRSLVPLVQSDRAAVVLASLTQLIKTRHPDLPRIMAGLLNSPHPRVADLARRYLQRIAFDAYWKNFKDLSPRCRFTAGQAIFKLDPAAPDRWRRRAADRSAAHRLQAIRIARELARVDSCRPELQRLARDSDPYVRSCAVGALGAVSAPLSSHILPALLEALRDADLRVRANAVEALEKHPLPTYAPALTPLTTAPDNRLRANAIKTLLAWKVASARRAVEQMLTDRRPRHRASAHWILREIQSAAPDTPSTPLEPPEPILPLPEDAREPVMVNV